jgi:hypothetical protein
VNRTRDFRATRAVLCRLSQAGEKNSETQLPVGGGLRGVGSRIRASKDARERAYALDRSCRVERKIDKWSAAALLQSRATLQQGLPLRRERDAAGQFWTFTMSNSGRKTSTFAETMNPGVELRMHVFLTRIASGDARHRRHVSDARVRSRTTRVQRWRKPLFSELFRAIWSLLPVGGGFCPPPVSPVFSNPVRVASAAIGNRHRSHA